jgi:hypothetical protein
VTVIAKGRGGEGHDPESGLSATGKKKSKQQPAGVKYHVVKMFVEVEV